MNRLRERIKELVGQSPSSVAYLADVTGADEADVQRELARLEKAGEVSARRLVVYRAQEKDTPRDMRIDEKVKQRLLARLRAA